MNITKILSEKKQDLDYNIEEIQNLITELEDKMTELENEKDSLDPRIIKETIEEMKALIGILSPEEKEELKRELFEPQEDDDDDDPINDLEPPTVSENLEKIESHPETETSEVWDRFPEWSEIRDRIAVSGKKRMMMIDGEIIINWSQNGLLIHVRTKLKKHLESAIHFFKLRHNDVLIRQDIKKTDHVLKYEYRHLIDVDDVDKSLYNKVLETLEGIIHNSFKEDDTPPQKSEEEEMETSSEPPKPETEGIVSFETVTKMYNEIFRHQNRLNWSDQRLSEWLKENFNVERLALLSDDNLIKAQDQISKIEEIARVI